MTILEIHPSCVAERRTVGERSICRWKINNRILMPTSTSKKYLFAAGESPFLAIQLFQLKNSLLENYRSFLQWKLLLIVHSRNRIPFRVIDT